MKKILAEMTSDSSVEIVNQPISAKTSKPKKKVSWPSDDQLVRIKPIPKIKKAGASTGNVNNRPEPPKALPNSVTNNQRPNFNNNPPRDNVVISQTPFTRNTNNIVNSNNPVQSFVNNANSQFSNQPRNDYNDYNSYQQPPPLS